MDSFIVHGAAERPPHLLLSSASRLKRAAKRHSALLKAGVKPKAKRLNPSSSQANNDKIQQKRLSNPKSI
jgi:hypothetical protein